MLIVLDTVSYFSSVMCARAQILRNPTLSDPDLAGVLAGGVVADQCAWFACGPGVRVRLQKAVAGPHWLSLLRDGVKMVQCKVDWSSWLDEDEETEVPRYARDMLGI